MTKRVDGVYGPTRTFAHWQPDWTWYALRVEPQRELAIETILRDDGRHAFVPIKHVLTKKSRHTKRKVLSARSQYPGYVFIGFGPGEDPPWLDVLRFRAIHGVLAFQGEPWPIYEPTMTAMLAGSRRPINYINRPKTHRRRNRGQRTAEIVSGPYQGKTVRVVEISENDLELFELFKVAA